MRDLHVILHVLLVLIEVGSAFDLEGGTLVEDGTFYESVDDFYYLGDRISEGGGVDAAVSCKDKKCAGLI